MKNFICPSCRHDANMKNVIDNKKLRENIEWYKNLLSEPVISTHNLIKNFANLKEQTPIKDKIPINNTITTNTQTQITQNVNTVNLNQGAINNSNKEIKIEEKKIENTQAENNNNNVINPNIQSKKTTYPKHLTPNPNPNNMIQMMMNNPIMKQQFFWNYLNHQQIGII